MVLHSTLLIIKTKKCSEEIRSFFMDDFSHEKKCDN